MALLRKEIRDQWLQRQIHTRSLGVTRWLGRRYGSRFGFIYVGGYPKSGTTWMSQLVGHYLDIPFPDHNVLPLSFRCVVHHHWDHEPAFDHSFQVVRDGRDVMVSMYMNLMRAEQGHRERGQRFGRTSFLERRLLNHWGRDQRLSRRFQRILGRDFDPWDHERNLPRFIEADMQRPLIEITPRPWPQYVRRWNERGRRTVQLRYEDLLKDGPGTLLRSLGDYLDEEIDVERAMATLERYAFARKTGRRRGQEDRNQFARKGIRGDWRNHFNREARQVFDHHAGSLLIELGYERDRSWVERPRAAEPTHA